ncbi:GNAT family N-acetyltransferase [Desulfosporosinus sp. PR]|uniref:GNAT family N-acetyltransferase n=1 Tax=Candidatus Desulfosporosinus nitrosoreducens TaxID=3401928 RepID=UPI0027EC528B|nr:GNAT family N-acetyltransferase [Desulfosporosinus sp. PR]MDQ7097196.1 GNAT family N-acetyltransferase [Desulfosporosinus sp. PR]
MDGLNFRELSLDTDRLVLKVLDENFADVILDYFKRNMEFLKEWEPVKDPEFYTLPYQQEVVHEEMSRIMKGGTFRVWLFKKSDGLSRTIGSIALNNIVYGAFLSCHLGYRLDGEEVNQGYMTEALEKVIEFAFKTMGLHRIEANILPRNLRSMRVVEKLGFYNEGLAKKYLRINGKWEDHIHMVLLND